MKKILTITKALGDENRLRALIMLQNGELCVCRIIEMLQLAPSTVSKHMSILKQAGLVETRRAGKWTYCRLADVVDGSPETEIIAWLLRQLGNDRKIIADAARLAEIRAQAAAENPKSCACKKIIMHEAISQMNSTSSFPDRALQFLMSAHDAVPGVTENVLKYGKTVDGRSSYEVLADTVNLKNGMTAVDLACGSGVLTRLLSQRVGPAGQVVGIDLNHSELTLAEARCKGCANVQFYEESADVLSLPDASVDAVLCHMALMLFRPVEPVLAEISRILRPGGTLAAVMPDPNGGNAMFAAVRKAVANAVAEDVSPEKLIAIGSPEFGSESGIRELFDRTGKFDGEPRFSGFEVIFRETPEALAELLMPFFYYTGLLSQDGREQLKNAWADLFRQAMTEGDNMAVFRLSLSIFTICRK